MLLLMLKTDVMLNIVETVIHLFYIQERSAKTAYKNPCDKEY